MCCAWGVFQSRDSLPNPPNNSWIPFQGRSWGWTPPFQSSPTSQIPLLPCPSSHDLSEPRVWGHQGRGTEPQGSQEKLLKQDGHNLFIANSKVKRCTVQRNSKSSAMELPARPFRRLPPPSPSSILILLLSPERKTTGWEGEHGQHGANSSGLSGCQREEPALPCSWRVWDFHSSVFVTPPQRSSAPSLPARPPQPLGAARIKASQHPCEVGNEPAHVRMRRTGNPPSLCPVKPVVPVCVALGEAQDGTTTLWVCF